MREPAYDPEIFRRAGHRLVDRLAEHLHAAQAARLPVLSESSPLSLAEHYRGGLPREPVLLSEEDLLNCVDRVLEQSIHLHHPGYIGHQVPPPLPVTALAELIAGVLNQSVAIYEMAPAGTQIERQTVRWLCELLGWPASADGVFTSGGSLGNLTALLAARNRATNGAAWQHGVRSCPPLAVIVSEEAHYSVVRAAGILGIGEDGVIKVPVNDRFQIDLSALAQRCDAATREGKRVVAVVATAGTTATGSYDPLQEIGAFCREHGIWFHVDGAHGASVLLSSTYKSLAQGIELADSVVWDAHKMLFVPSLATAVLFRERADNYQAFSQQAGYLFDREAAERDFDVALRTVECTKKMLALKLWFAFQLYGAAGLGALVTRTIDLARSLADLLKTQPDFELLVEPMCNIVCFRHRPDWSAKACRASAEAPRDLEALNAHQRKIRRSVVASGKFFLVQTRIGGAVYLRTAIMNPNTTEADFARLLELIRECSAA